MSFFDEIKAASVPLVTKAEVVNWYQTKFPGLGHNGWKQNIIRDIVPFTPQRGKNPEKNIARRFDPSRINRQEKRNEWQYEALEKFRAPDGGYHIQGFVWVKFSDGECEEREIDEIVKGEEADALALAAAEELKQVIVNIYMMEDPNEKEPSADTGPCREPDLVVEPVE